MNLIINSPYFKEGCPLLLATTGLYLGLRYAAYRMVKGRVAVGYPVPKFSQNYIKGKNVLVVGGTNGLGLAISRVLAKNGGYVTVVGRTDPKDDSLAFLKADLSTVKNQLDLAMRFSNPENLDILIFTQGIITPPARIDNGEGIEIDLAVSYIGRRVILEQLLERGAKPDRVFIMGFCGTEVSIEDFNGQQNYRAFPQHMNTVAANDALVLGYRKRRPDIPIYGLNPGLIKTGIRANVYKGNKFLANIVETFIGWLTPSPTQYGEMVKHVIAALHYPRKPYSLINTAKSFTRVIIYLKRTMLISFGKKLINSSREPFLNKLII